VEADGPFETQEFHWVCTIFSQKTEKKSYIPKGSEALGDGKKDMYV
jgi:hypothetical protein